MLYVNYILIKNVQFMYLSFISVMWKIRKQIVKKIKKQITYWKKKFLSLQEAEVRILRRETPRPCSSQVQVNNRASWDLSC